MHGGGQHEGVPGLPGAAENRDKLKINKNDMKKIFFLNMITNVLNIS